jgi:hypothetical protein
VVGTTLVEQVLRVRQHRDGEPLGLVSARALGSAVAGAASATTVPETTAASGALAAAHSRLRRETLSTGDSLGAPAGAPVTCGGTAIVGQPNKGHSGASGPGYGAGETQLSSDTSEHTAGGLTGV